MPTTNPKRTFVALNGNGGAFTTIRLSTFAKYVRIVDDKSQNGGVTQGVEGNYIDPFASTAQIAAGEGLTPAAAGGAVFIADDSVEGSFQPAITFGSKHALSDWKGMPLGNPGSDGAPAVPGGQPSLGTPLIQLRSYTATPCGVIVEEYVG